MIGNNVSQQWVITRDDHGHPAVYVDLDVNTSQPLTSDAYDLLTQATYNLGELAAHLRHTEPGAPPETVDSSDRLTEFAERNLREDLRGLVDRVNAVSLNGVEPVYEFAQGLTKKYDL